MKTFKILLSTVAIAALITTVACKKDEEKKDGKTDDGAGKTVDGDKKTDDKKTADTKPDDKKPDTKAGGDMTNEQKAEAGLKMMNEVGKLFTDNAGDCDKTAAALSKYVDDNKEMLEKGREWDKDPEFKKLFDEKYKDKVMAAMGPMMESMGKCKDNKNLEAAMKKFAGE